MPYSVLIECSGQLAGSLVIYAAPGCTGEQLGTEPLEGFQSCGPFEAASPFVGVATYQTVTCVSGAYTPSAASAESARTVLYSLDETAACDVGTAPFADVVYPTINSCFTDGTNSAIMSCTNTSAVMTTASWSGPTCSGELLANSTLLTLGVCANASLSTCGAAGGSPAGTPGPASNTALIVGASVGAAVAVAGAAAAFVAARRYGLFPTWRRAAASGGADENTLLVK